MIQFPPRIQLKHSFRYLSVDGLREFLWVLGDKTLVLTVIVPYLVTSQYPRTQDVFLLLAFIRPVQFLWLGVMLEACKGFANCHVSIKRITVCPFVICIVYRCFHKLFCLQNECQNYFAAAGYNLD